MLAHVEAIILDGITMGTKRCACSSFTVDAEEIETILNVTLIAVKCAKYYYEVRLLTILDKILGLVALAWLLNLIK